MKNYKELNVWKKGIEIVKVTYQLSKSFPSEEKFGLVSQMTRSAVSISANIAEGSSRNSDKDYARFLQIALGSAFELQTYFVIGKEMGWISLSEFEVSDKLLEEEIKMIHAFLKQLKS
jgi:four helix bundle protein